MAHEPQAVTCRCVFSFRFLRSFLVAGFDARDFYTDDGEDVDVVFHLAPPLRVPKPNRARAQSSSWTANCRSGSVHRVITRSADSMRFVRASWIRSPSGPNASLMYSI